MNKKRTVPFHPIGGGQLSSTILARVYKNGWHDIMRTKFLLTSAITYYDEESKADNAL